MLIAPVEIDAGLKIVRRQRGIEPVERRDLTISRTEREARRR